MENSLNHIINHTTISLVKGDITQQKTTAIVNAANSSLLGGGGVDGAIHRAAGPKLLQETRKLNGCATGDAKITGAYNLPAQYVIHAVGPVYRPNDRDVAQLLDSCYYRSLEIAEENEITNISFPAISTGIYGYPIEEAAPISLKAVARYLDEHEKTCVTAVRFVLFTDDFLKVFNSELEKLKTQPS